MDFRVEGGVIRLRGALLAVIADTPASNLLGGYKKSIGEAKQKCRHCMTDFDKMQTMFEEDDFLLRSKELDDNHLKKIGTQSVRGRTCNNCITWCGTSKLG